MNAVTDLQTLKAHWQMFKTLEDGAKRDRLGVEEQILAHFPKDKLEGSITDADVGVTVTYKVARKVDTAKLQADWAKLSVNEQAAFKWSADVDTTKFKAIQELDPEAFSTVTAYVTTKSNKPSISMKEEK